jgi:D-sedoheptulose 7-phosphate isomerase
MDLPGQMAAGLARSARILVAMAEDAALCATAARVAEVTAEALGAGRKLLLCGNGGSAADAQHWAAELVGRFLHDRPPLAAIALTTDSSALTCIGNDYGFEQVFARQVAALGQGGDVLFALSTSGNSANVLAALEIARGRGMLCVGFTGMRAGRMDTLCDLLLRVPSTETARIQEGHEALGHALCGAIEARLFPRPL